VIAIKPATMNVTGFLSFQVDSTSFVPKYEALAHELIQAVFHQFPETINS
jgi:hypothetical protein